MRPEPENHIEYGVQPNMEKIIIITAAVNSTGKSLKIRVSIKVTQNSIT